MFNRFEYQFVQFQDFCYNNKFEKIRQILTNSTQRQREKLIESTVKANYPLVQQEDDHLVGFSPIHLASEVGDLDVMKLLILFGADVNKSCSMGNPLLGTMLFNQKDAFELLLKNGADINSSAELHDNGNAYHLLFQIGVDPADDDDIRAKEWVKLLYENKCEVNHSDSNGDIPLVFCSPPCLDLFLNIGADINKINNIGQIPLRFYESSLRGNATLLEVEFYITIIRHVEKLKALGKMIAVENLELYRRIIELEDNFDQSDYFEEQAILKRKEMYVSECEKLKETYIYRNISLHTLLHSPTSKWIMFFNNIKFNETFDFKKLKIDFPNYYFFLEARYNESRTRKNLLDPAKEQLLSIFYHYCLSTVLRTLLHSSRIVILNFYNKYNF